VGERLSYDRMASSSSLLSYRKAVKTSKHDATTPEGLNNLLKYEIQKAMNMRSRYKKQGRAEDAKVWDYRINQLRQFLAKFLEDRESHRANFTLKNLVIPEIPPFDEETIGSAPPAELPSRVATMMKTARTNMYRARKRQDVIKELRWWRFLQDEQAWLAKARSRARCGIFTDRFIPPKGFLKRGRPKGPWKRPEKRVRNPFPKARGRPRKGTTSYQPIPVERAAEPHEPEQPMRVERLTEEQARRLILWGDIMQPQDASDDDGAESPSQREFAKEIHRQLMTEDQRGGMPPTPWDSDDET
jgi:hypothetical protein